MDIVGIPGYGDGYGYGSGSGKVTLSRKNAWTAYHYICQSETREGKYRMKGGKIVAAGDPVHEDKIELCQRGLHASLSELDARQFRPQDAVLTRVLVWGDIIVGKDKLVATDRMIVEEERCSLKST